MGRRAEITTAMREGIRAGRWKAGDQLPTVHEVCEQYSVSTSTAVYAMLDLGPLVDARQGKGYFVADNAAELLHDSRPRAIVDAHTELVALRDELDQIIARLAA